MFLCHVTSCFILVSIVLCVMYLILLPCLVIPDWFLLCTWLSLSFCSSVLFPLFLVLLLCMLQSVHIKQIASRLFLPLPLSFLHLGYHLCYIPKYDIVYVLHVFAYREPCSCAVLQNLNCTALYVQDAMLFSYAGTEWEDVYRKNNKLSIMIAFFSLFLTLTSTSTHCILQHRSSLWLPDGPTMFSLLLFAVLCVSSLAKPTFIHYSYSRDVGGGSGSSFSTEGEGRITAIRVWEIYGAYITGIQLRYDNSWADVVGRIYDTPQEMELFDGEAIDQISGKFDNNYIYQVIFGTSRGRSLIVGQPTQGSFNFYPNHPDAELRLLSGRFNGNGITSLGAHWGVVFTH
ncbi:uncharacterized protein LOC100698396 isoform X1 [Oreochromis niloticus]|uniref:Zymogen granule membrane protein 16 n=1 Tax=Oreochromis niloticus TaxID=8128 RepID=A0A669F1E1_ORENI|nr:uncharacterized protein LOC100698396 isoform X1 [Oreochromis niloticus]